MVDTNDLMQMALDLADLKSTPSDSAIYVEGDSIQKLIFAINAGVPELMLAKQLGYDAVISHHPKGGRAVTEFHHVFRRHVQQMTGVGIPEADAESAMLGKMKSLEVEMHTGDYRHTIDVARTLKMPYLNIHTPLDELGRRIMARKTAMVEEDSKVSDVVHALMKIPEFRHATTKIEVRLGKADNTAGKIKVSHGAGTNGGYEIARVYYKYGVNTLIYIHISPPDLRKLEADKQTGNLIITGHVASDSVGINPYIKELEKRDLSVTRLGIIPA